MARIVNLQELTKFLPGKSEGGIVLTGPLYSWQRITIATNEKGADA